MDRGQHRGGQGRRSDRRRYSGREQRATAGLGDARRERVLTPGAHAHALESLRGRREPAPTEPAEELLRTVANEERADRQAQEQSQHGKPPAGRMSGRGDTDRPRSTPRLPTRTRRESQGD